MSMHSMLPDCLLRPNCGCHAVKNPTAEKIQRHDAEQARRLNWCISNKLVPAFDHIHKAPGDDKEFVYGVAPWNKDGTVNPAGVYSEGPSESDAKLLSYCKESPDMQWACRKCNKIVPRKPSLWTKAGEEPWNWWHCFDCRAKYTKPAKRILDIERTAQKCARIDNFFKKG